MQQCVNPIIEIIINDIPPSPNSYLGRNWTSLKKIKEEWREKIMKTIIFNYPNYIQLYCVPPEKRTLEITIMCPKLRDEDNLYASVKPIVDALKPIHRKIVQENVLGFIHDDSPDWLDLIVQQFKSRTRKTIVKLYSFKIKKKF